MTELILVNWLLELWLSLAGPNKGTHPTALLITLYDKDLGSWWNQVVVLNGARQGFFRQTCFKYFVHLILLQGRELHLNILTGIDMTTPFTRLHFYNKSTTKHAPLFWEQEIYVEPFNTFYKVLQTKKKNLHHH